ncbi:MAG TPA: STAS domain-containing protein [Azospirillum sp.]|nr:STAS domain-containing protein [Azospirillum sp.]
MAEQHRTEIRLAGSLTVATAEAVHGRLVEAMAKGGTIVVDCDDADAVDLSFVQLVVAARAAAEAKGAVLALRSPASGSLLEALRRGGFLAGHDGGCGERRFWMKEGA